MLNVELTRGQRLEHEKLLQRGENFTKKSG